MEITALFRILRTVQRLWNSLKYWQKGFLIGFILNLLISLAINILKIHYLPQIFIETYYSFASICFSSPFFNFSIGESSLCLYNLLMSPVFCGIAGSIIAALIRTIMLMKSRTLDKLSIRTRNMVYIASIFASSIVYNEAKIKVISSQDPITANLAINLSILFFSLIYIVIFTSRKFSDMPVLRRFSSPLIRGLLIGALFGIVFGLYNLIISTVYGWQILTAPGNLNENAIISKGNVITFLEETAFFAIISAIIGVILGVIYKRYPTIGRTFIFLILIFYSYLIPYIILGALGISGSEIILN